VGRGKKRNGCHRHRWPSAGSLKEIKKTEREHTPPARRWAIASSARRGEKTKETPSVAVVTAATAERRGKGGVTIFLDTTRAKVKSTCSDFFAIETEEKGEDRLMRDRGGPSCGRGTPFFHFSPPSFTVPQRKQRKTTKTTAPSRSKSETLGRWEGARDFPKAK
jgi:hypothetical protein